MSGENETVAQPFKCFQGKGSKLKGYLGILILESDLKKKPEHKKPIYIAMI